MDDNENLSRLLPYVALGGLLLVVFDPASALYRVDNPLTWLLLLGTGIGISLLIRKKKAE